MGTRSSKLGTSVRGRANVVQRIAQWATDHRDGNRPLAWLHAASVGEGLHAKPVIEALRIRYPEWQFAYTFFSPSARAFAEELDVDLRDYLPYDDTRSMSAAVRALRPSLLVYAVADVWPTLTAVAHHHRARVALVSAAVRPRSARLRWPIRSMLHPAYRTLDLVGAANAEMAARVMKLGARVERVLTLGNTRFDSALARAEAAADNPWVQRLRRTRPTIVAGSTWPRDERVILEAFRDARTRHPDLRIIIAPHEPSPGRFHEIEGHAARLDLPPPTPMSAVEPEVDPAIIYVDRVGVLAALYTLCDVSYVGGGFGRRGLHSVLEPAALGKPTVVGPAWRSSGEAEALQRHGALETLPRREAAHVLSQIWTAIFVDPILAADMGRSARRVVDEGIGATDRTVAALGALLQV